MKPIFFLAFLLFAITAGEAQQKRDTIHAGSKPQKTKMKDELGLSKKQAAEVKASKKEYKAEKDKVEKNAALSESEKKEKIKHLKEEKNKKVDATLTPEQKEKAKMLKKKKKNSA